MGDGELTRLVKEPDSVDIFFLSLLQFCGILRIWGMN